MLWQRGWCTTPPRHGIGGSSKIVSELEDAEESTQIIILTDPPETGSLQTVSAKPT